MKLTGEIIQFLRFTRGIDQRTLARQVGIVQSSVSKMESGRLAISPTNNNRFMKAFDLSEADVILLFNQVQMNKRFK
ncbi:helix-turn-helix domain-containing protein [Oceanobacillus longus]|uniref:Helix-turn-helix domain-containing protein n=1 Tax=Oceanobacillus longus TaxID=930120 RepID=A0ABV8GV48_9BACI